METAETKTPVDLEKMKNQAIAVVTTPVEFFKSMAKSGGLQDPLIFLLLISVVTALIRALFMIAGSFVGAIGVLIITPIVAAVFGFIGAAIVYLIWNVMGSKENYETAYRCVAYASAILPITTLLSFIPYLGGLVGTAWAMYLIYVASVQVHQIPQKKAQTVWGIIFVVFALMGLMGEVGTRKAQKELDRWGQQIERGDVTPEEAGKMVGEFLMGLEKAAQKQQEQQDQGTK